MHKILVLSGGGARGIIQLDFLIKLEEIYKKKLCETFDLICGTSVGAISTGILSSGKLTANQYKFIFLNLVSSIFKKSWWKIGPIGMPIYSRDTFYKAMDEYVGKKFVMKDCKTKFLCTSVNLCDNKTHFFKSWEDKDGNILLSDAIARSFAAPYYFGMMIDDASKSLWIDGGTGLSNCPCDIAYIEALRLGWCNNNSPIEITVVGTGYSDDSLEFNTGKKMLFPNLRQIYQYLDPADGGMARVQSTPYKVDFMENLSKLHEKNITFRYYDIKIKKDEDTMVNLKYISNYLQYGEELAGQIK